MKEGIKIMRRSFTIAAGCILAIIVLIFCYAKFSPALREEYVEDERPPEGSEVAMPFFISNPDTSWKHLHIYGFDSYIGALVRTQDTVIFDYGWYGDDFSHVNIEEYRFAVDSMNGWKGVFVRSRETDPRILGLYIENLKGDNHLHMYNKQVHDEQAVLELFQCVKVDSLREKSTPRDINFIRYNWVPTQERH
jgi:hypothetical protein